MKKDYVPGYGDTIDLVVIAGSWEKDRARELRGRYCPGLVGDNTSQSALCSASLDPNKVLHWCIWQFFSMYSRCKFFFG